MAKGINYWKVINIDWWCNGSIPISKIGGSGSNPFQSANVGVAEWFKALDSKSRDGDDPSVGSNPTTSASKQTRKDIITMKRKYIKALKNAGVRYAEKDGAKVSVKHLKLYQVINLYYEYGLNDW